MTKKEKIEILKKTHTLQEQWRLENDIRVINHIRLRVPIDVHQVKTKIKKVNNEYTESVALFNLIFSPHRNCMFLVKASDQSLINNLEWRRVYLQAKRSGKLFDKL